MKALKELTVLKNENLDSKLVELQKELMKFRSQVAAGTIPRSPGRIKIIKKTMAQIYTIKSLRNSRDGKIANE